MSIHAALARISAKLVETGGIPKDGYNETQKFNFRGIDAMYNTLAPLFAEEGVIVIPTVVERVEGMHTNDKSKNVFRVAVKVMFTFTMENHEPQNAVTATVYGEGFDTGDKATAKAMSMAYKAAMVQVFSIPTEGVDPDEESHETVAETQAAIEPTLKAELLAQLKESISLDELQKRFRAALKVASEARDAKFYGEVINTKNEVKALIEQAAAAEQGEAAPDVEQVVEREAPTKTPRKRKAAEGGAA